MSIQKYPCADCPDCLAIGEGEGICGYLIDEEAETVVPMVVKLFDVYPNCPKPEEKTKEGK